MFKSVFTEDDNNNAAIRTVMMRGIVETNKKDIFTEDEDGNAAIRVVGSGGDQHNLGYYATLADLQTAHPTAEAGDWAIVGTTDTVWIWDEDTSAWVDSDQKGQVTSVGGQTGDVDIKTINGNTIVGAGNLELSTYLTYPAGWTTNSTTKAFCDDIAADSSATKSKAYLGEVTINDLPAGIVNAEIVVEVMDGTTAADKVIVLTLTSGSVAPYMWKYTYWNNGNNVSGWQGFSQTTVTFRAWGANE